MLDRFRPPIVDWIAQREALVRGRYGVIEARGGQVVAVHLRRWPTLAPWPEIWPVGPTYHARGAVDRCLLHYNQPRRFPGFLALRYLVSTHATSYRTVRAALDALDNLAELKGVDALLCDVANSRLTDRMMARHGWVSHKPQRRHRNFIKRFYGAYPARRAAGAPC